VRPRARNLLQGVGGWVVGCLDAWVAPRGGIPVVCHRTEAALGVKLYLYECVCCALSLEARMKGRRRRRHILLSNVAFIMQLSSGNCARVSAGYPIVCPSVCVWALFSG